MNCIQFCLKKRCCGLFSTKSYLPVMIFKTDSNLLDHVQMLNGWGREENYYIDHIIVFEEERNRIISTEDEIKKYFKKYALTYSFLSVLYKWKY